MLVTFNFFENFILLFHVVLLFSPGFRSLKCIGGISQEAPGTMMEFLFRILIIASALFVCNFPSMM